MPLSHRQTEIRKRQETVIVGDRRLWKGSGNKCRKVSQDNLSKSEWSECWRWSAGGGSCTDEEGVAAGVAAVTNPSLPHQK